MGVSSYPGSGGAGRTRMGARASSPLRLNLPDCCNGLGWTVERRRRVLVRHRILRCRPSGERHSGLHYRACAGPTPARCSTVERRRSTLAEVVAYIGLDWADERHSVHLQPAEGPIEQHVLEQKPAVLHEWVAQLQQRFAGGKIAVALEQRKGAVIHALLMYDCFVLYRINP